MGISLSFVWAIHFVKCGDMILLYQPNHWILISWICFESKQKTPLNYQISVFSCEGTHGLDFVLVLPLIVWLRRLLFPLLAPTFSSLKMSNFTRWLLRQFGVTFPVDVNIKTLSLSLRWKEEGKERREKEKRIEKYIKLRGVFLKVPDISGLSKWKHQPSVVTLAWLWEGPGQNPSSLRSFRVFPTQWKSGGHFLLCKI